MARLLYRSLWLVLAGFTVLYLYVALWNLPRLAQENRYALVLAGFFGAAALFMLARSEGLRIFGTWFGIFLILQLLVPPDLGLVKTHVSRAPNLVRYVEPEGMHGVTGLQMFTTDSEGFRSDPHVDYRRKERLRIVALGGSATEEFVLDDRATWSNLLQQGLRKQGIDVEVINAGMSGTRTEHHVETLEYLLRFEPDIAIFLIGYNDWREGMRRHNFPRLAVDRLWPTNTLLIQSIRRLHQLYYPRGRSAPLLPRLADGSVADVPEEYRTVIRREEAEGPRVRRLRGNPSGISDRFKNDLMDALQTCRKGKIRCLMMTQPSAYQEDADPAYLKAIQTSVGARMIAYAQRYHDHLRQFAKENGLPLCDLAARIRPTLDVFYDAVHFNTSGARRVAALVQDCVLPMLSDAGRLPKLSGGAS